ncbi:MAG TPA: TIM barrel protein [Bryobacteraceae bacterium]|nr:TIM barrel protein [Bryobacteraceae bacterium]
MYSRRDVGKIALGCFSSSVAGAAKINSTVDGVRLGTITYSYHDLPRTPGGNQVDVVIAALKDNGIGIIELFSPHVEPSFQKPLPPGDPAARRARMKSPEALQAREELRKWRLAAPDEYFKATRKKFDDAGIDVYAYTINFRDDFTDEEIDRGFQHAKAIGVKVISCSTQLTMAQRLAPFAEKHKMYVAIHGHNNVSDPNEFSTPATFQKALNMSRYFKVNLDIGHFTAANCDSLAYIKENHKQITHLHVKDMKRNGGTYTEFGEGDAPIKQVLLLLKEKKYPIPCFAEYEYKGNGTATEEVARCMTYMKQALT